jgi:allantoin racemase
MRILWIDPIGTDVFSPDSAEILRSAARSGTLVDVVSLKEAGRPKHLEYHVYEALVIGDIVKVVHGLAPQYNAIVIGCFYDVGLHAAREVSGKTIVTAPCQSAVSIAVQLGHRFSVLVGREKWIPQMVDNIRLYGFEGHLASMRSLGLGVHDFHADPGLTQERLLTEGRKAVEEDGAEVLVLGCTAEYGFQQAMQAELGVPVIDAMQAPFKMAELLADTAERFGWYPSRVGGSEAPPREEVESWELFADDLPIGTYLRDEGNNEA